MELLTVGTMDDELEQLRAENLRLKEFLADAMIRVEVAHEMYCTARDEAIDSVIKEMAAVRGQVAALKHELAQAKANHELR